MSRGLLSKCLVVMLVSLPVFAQGEGDATGVVPTPSLEERTRPRVRAGVSLVAATGFSFPYFSFNAAPGLGGELGVIFNDSVSVTARATVASVLVMTVAHFGVSVDRVLGERACLGVGLAFTVLGGFVDQPGSSGISLPVRISWMFNDRPPEQRGRQGFYVFGEATPGIALLASPGYGGRGIVPGTPRGPPGPPLTISASIGIGYGWW